MNDIFDTLLDKSLDDLKDLPEFKIPDTGIYKLSVKVEMKEINKKPAIVAKFKVREVVELEDSSIPETERSKAGDGFDIPFMLRNEDGTPNELGEGRFKEFSAPFANHFEEKNLRTLVTEKLNSEVDITAKIKKVARKTDAEKFDARVSDISID